MATNLAKIEALLTELAIKYRKHDEETLVVGYSTENYTDKDGDKILTFIIRIAENGEFLHVICPKCYTYPATGANKAAVMEALVRIQYKVKMLRYEYDSADGEIRANIDLALEDAELGKRQLQRLVTAFKQLVDEYDGVVRKAMDEGIVEFPDKSQAAAAGGGDTAALLSQLFKAAQEAGMSQEEIAKLMQEAIKKSGA